MDGVCVSVVDVCGRGRGCLFVDCSYGGDCLCVGILCQTVPCEIDCDTRYWEFGVRVERC